MNNTNTKLASNSLEAIRKKLLNLTTRNRLLSFKHAKSNSLRIIDELPDQIYSELKDGKTFSFIPVPEPTEKELIDAGYLIFNSETQEYELKDEPPIAIEWAKHLGLAVSYDLPDNDDVEEELDIHQDTNLQTLHYSRLLEPLLRNIRSKSEQAIEEGGINILYLNLGFLEWYESPNSDIARYAPLFTIPVKLERSKKANADGVFNYKITMKEDGLLTNISFKEKLSNDFGLSLPEIDEDISPEKYFDLVTSTILKREPRWKLRRQVSLVILNFSKQLMYQDLNPENWPDGNSFLNHPTISRLLGASETEENLDDSYSEYTEEYNIDGFEDIHANFPLVFDADSSQHSAIIDAVNGENLVVEGPPGSGKSQTIANMIAANLANGKKVLFVAEKMAALNVVKQRLDKIGLGDLCLELHSHKTNKLKIIQDLGTSLANRTGFYPPEEIAISIERYEKYKNILNDYAELINSKWKTTSFSIHDILNKAVKLREQYKLNPSEINIAEIDGTTFTALRQKEIEDDAKSLTDIYHQVSEQTVHGKIENHFWFGVNNFNLTGYEEEELVGNLQKWSDGIENFLEYWQENSAHVNFGKLDDLETNELEFICDVIANLPILHGDELLKHLEQLNLFKDDLNSVIVLYENTHMNYEPILENFNENIFDRSCIEEIRKAQSSIVSLGIDKHVSVEQIVGYSKKLDVKIKVIHGIQTNIDQIYSKLPVEFEECFDVSINGFDEIRILFDLMESLPSQYWQHKNNVYDNQDLHEPLVELLEKTRKLQEYYKDLHELFNMEHVQNLSVLKRDYHIAQNGGMFKSFSSTWRAAKNNILSMSLYPKTKLSRLLNLMPKLIAYKAQLELIEKYIKENPLVDGLYSGVETPVDRIFILSHWYKKVRLQYGWGFGERVKIGDKLFSMDDSLARNLTDFYNSSLKQSVEDVVRYYDEICVVFKNPFIQNDKKENLIVKLETLESTVDFSLKKLGIILKNSTLNLPEINGYLIKAEQQLSYKEEWDKYSNVLHILNRDLSLSISVNQYSENVLSSLKNTQTLLQSLSNVNVILDSLSACPSEERYNDIKLFSDKIKLYLDEIKTVQKNFSKLGDVDIIEWIGDLKTISSELIERNKIALENKVWLQTWLDYVRVKNKISNRGLDDIAKLLEDKKINESEVLDIINLVCFDLLSKEILNENPDLKNFSGVEQVAIRKRFAEYDINIRDLQRKWVVFNALRNPIPRGNSTGRIGTYTQCSLIEHNMGLQRPRVAVRTLLDKADRAIQGLKPCFMMSPMSVAQYLKPGQFDFDLVIMDEASQIRPEDALGAIARGEKVVIVGDPKQLPPTSFFQKFTNDDVPEEDQVALEASESILDSVLPIFKTRRLRWHYRSQHQELIAFSNEQFYDSNLIIFPSPHAKKDGLGIQYHRVKSGQLKNRRNVSEARTLVKTASEMLINQLYELKRAVDGENLSEIRYNTIGIVAMNTEQQDEIARQLEQAEKEDDRVREAREILNGMGEPVFVKNLENVQGDERDIILISMTYGPDTIGSSTMAQRFGPINSNVGWRRLNVLFTRSKRQMHIFSSMDSGHIRTHANSSRGVLALRQFLTFCETGSISNYNHTGKSTDSDFEIAVMDALTKYGYECEPQLGVAGYFLDIVVKDPGQPGRFLMAVECDGATYHSAKSARDRDRLRQSNLENLGWKVRRIWSTDWFKNPESQLQPILRELDELKTPIIEVEELANQSSVEESDFLNDLTDVYQEVVSNADEIKDEEIIVETSEYPNLFERLSAFNVEVIRKEVGDIEISKQLLRPALLEAICNSLPCTRTEFLEVIPTYLRGDNIDKKDGKYLDRVLQIVEQYGD